MSSHFTYDHVYIFKVLFRNFLFTKILCLFNEYCIRIFVYNVTDSIIVIERFFEFTLNRHAIKGCHEIVFKMAIGSPDGRRDCLLNNTTLETTTTFETPRQYCSTDVKQL